MAIEKTIETPYRTNVRPAEIRVSSRRRNAVVVVSGVGALILSSAVVLEETPRFTSHCGVKDGTKSSLKALHAVAEAWRANHGNECPTPQRLKDEKELAASSDVNDAWGDPYKIWCTDDATTVVSWGADKKAGTQDDIAFPDET